MKLALSFLLVPATLMLACSQRPMTFVPTDSPTAPTDSPTPVVNDVPSAGACMRQADCDDNIACTTEQCIVGGVCERTTNDAMCPMGQRCFLGRGCASGSSCTSNADCDDHVPCTRDVCAAGGMCQIVRDDSRCMEPMTCSLTLGCVMPGMCGVDADCDDRRYCNGTERCTGGRCVQGMVPDCSDGNACTGDVCDEATRMCQHPMLNPCGGQIVAGTYDVTPGPRYMCGSGMFGPVTSLAVETNVGGIIVRGFPVELRGGAPSMGTFSATGTWVSGPCTWQFALQGAATMANQFRGTWSVSFDNCSIIYACNSTFDTFTATLH